MKNTTYTSLGVNDFADLDLILSPADWRHLKTFLLTQTSNMMPSLVKMLQPTSILWQGD